MNKFNAEEYEMLCLHYFKMKLRASVLYISVHVWNDFSASAYINSRYVAGLEAVDKFEW